MKYRLLVVDIDGTIVDRYGSISAEDREAISRVRGSGIPVALSTGRVARACRQVIEELALDGYHIFFDGALVSSPSADREIYVQPLSPELVQEAVEFVHANDIYFELFSAADFFVERETWATEIRRRFFRVTPTVVDFAGIWERERIIKAQLITASPQDVARAGAFHERFNGKLRFSYARTPAYPGVDFINVLAPEVSKGRALEVLAAHLGVSLDGIIAIGDGSNDIPLLAAAGLAVAMGDAPDEVKAVADYVTLDVDHSGLAAAVNRFLL